MNFISLFKLIDDHEAMYAYLAERGLMRIGPVCHVCGGVHFKVHTAKPDAYTCQRCGALQHALSIGVVRKSWLFDTGVDIDRILIMAYMFAAGYTRHDEIIEETSLDGARVTRAAAKQWMHFFREVIRTWCCKHLAARTGFDLSIYEYLWRQYVRREKLARFEHLLECVRGVDEPNDCFLVCKGDAEV